MSVTIQTGRKRKYGSTAADNAARKSVRRARANAVKRMGIPATRGFRGEYGKYRRTYKEKKIIDLQLAQSFVNDASTAGTGLRLLNGVQQGSDYTERIGRKISMTSVFFRCTVSLAASPNAASQVVRLMIVYDEQANNAAAAGTDILTPDTSVESLMNLSNRDRFKVLYDKIRLLSAQGVTDGNLGDKAYFTKYIKMNLPVVFSGTGATIGAIQTGALYVLFSGTVATAAATRATAAWESRVRFIDD